MVAHHSNRNGFATLTATPEAASPNAATDVTFPSSASASRSQPRALSVAGLPSLPCPPITSS